MSEEAFIQFCNKLLRNYRNNPTADGQLKKDSTHA